MALTTKELQLIQDNIKMGENTVKFMEGCSEMVSDPQIKGMCSQIAREHQSDIQTLMKHISQSSMQ
jgi:rubrerythrin